MTIHRFTILGRPISLKNAKKVGKRRIYSTPEVVEWMESARQQIHMQWNQPPLEGEWAVGVIVFQGAKQSIDAGNAAAGALDALEGWQAKRANRRRPATARFVTVIGNDYHLVPQYVDRARDRGNPRVEVVMARDFRKVLAVCEALMEMNA